ncbi:MAG: hypothetical protein ACRC0B_02530 [Legionella sp.]
MDTSKNTETMSTQKAQVNEAAANLLNESKKMANELYNEGLNKVCEAEDQMKEYSEHLIKKVKENPVSAVLIAGGIGFLLSKILK